MRLSLRLRVAAATALGATIVVASLAVVTSVAISRNNVNQLDERLTTASQALVPNTAVLETFLNQLSSAFAVTIRTGDTIRASTPIQLPDLPEGSQTVDVGGQRFRVYTTTTTSLIDLSIAIGVPAIEAQQVTDEQQRLVLFIGLGAIAVSTGLGWIFGGRAVKPLVTLTRQVSAQPPLPPDTKTGVKEADELATAIGGMLQRVNDAQERTNDALATARDFAAVSAHELRTPLTAMRTDIEVLRTLDLERAQQQEILGDLDRTQGRVETTLGALEKLASGELQDDSDRVDTDIVDICDVAAQDAMRQHPDLTVRIESEPSVTMRGFPAGLRLAVDNAIVNAIRHGDAKNLVLAIRRDEGRVVLTVDDDGTGVPVDERDAVFERFYRGAAAAKGGSGLGLALVEQQAQLHGGTAYFTDSPLGGARLVMELSAAAPPVRG
ncbi:HAMP domain-containing histidine kinase [Rhodococcus sp. BP-252]|uniref:histidine kinase n=1 Tax=Rhodococcoides kyotonense TaxID=398843 RepID=A0A177YG70_9NOCA|nr:MULTISPECIES: HAMP domain-containing sensor histidine kinase [Rhodococcus]NIL76704.1 Sensor-type histidine kinase PrrB [Rhodococcus sp. B10]MBY6413071.1 HAMP domain-containing histidine kinase [Rhodococcus sp. BP-320]MBY6417766.1 HAMP domain-containing histidine kinase [Rhodococcus sp. BP-321]MBY6423916.1 HAMP domain-containing histidine kinase [Rhodococcus sp. BP-324]MBY6427813.1 HAMP domain-containing histidine kinase [Rhodococcus sp. BP-323]